MRPPRLILLTELLAACLSLSSCGPMFYAEMDEDSFCGTLLSQSFPGAPIGGIPIDQTIQYDLGEKFSLLNHSAVIERSVRVQSLHIITSGIDLSGTSGLLVTAQPTDGSTQPPATIVDMPIQSSQGQVSQINAVANDQVELVPYLFDGAKLSVTMHLKGILPTQPWTADVKACIKVRVKIDPIAVIQNGSH